jgi:hypothetical protein
VELPKCVISKYCIVQYHIFKVRNDKVYYIDAFIYDAQYFWGVKSQKKRKKRRMGREGKGRGISCEKKF